MRNKYGLDIIIGEFWVQEYTKNGINQSSVLQIMRISNSDPFVITNHVNLDNGQIEGIKYLLTSEFGKHTGLRKAIESEIKGYQNAFIANKHAIYLLNSDFKISC